MPVFYLPVGQDLRDASLGNSRFIQGIVIDNPSGSWLRVTGIEQYVPPYTVGWSYPVVPAAASLDVLFTDSPSGSPSELVGNPVTVNLYDELVPNHPGELSGALGNQEPGIAPISVVEVGIITQGSVYTNLIAGALRQIIVPVQATFAYDNGIDGPSVPVKAEFDSSVFPMMWISPESPWTQCKPVQGYRLPTGAPLRYRFKLGGGGGGQSVNLRVEFYTIIG
jgi:hypothetical protein